MDPSDAESSEPPERECKPPQSLATRLRYFLVGPPRDLRDRDLYHRLSLVAFLAWVGLGADGLSSSAYGPEEAFRTLGPHTYLALGLAALMAITVLVISTAYRRIIEAFPTGGGGYVVSTKLLGARAGVVSGSALIVDYALTITVSIAAAGDALFSLLPIDFQAWKLPVEIAFIAFLTLLNLRGVRESVLTLTPVFLLFLLTHAILIGGGVLLKGAQLPDTLRAAETGWSNGLATLGAGGMILLFLRAFSLGGGTYTGIEAVSNGLGIMREPRVRTAKRTMLYMGTSLAFTASGLLLCYLLWNVEAVEGKTLNAVLVERFTSGVPGGVVFVILTLVSEGALLVVAAQAGFVDGPRVLASMAVDSWVPRRLAALSDRLTIKNGILLMSLASLGALLYTRGDVRHIVVMYSINVFLTFTLSMLGMLRASGDRRRPRDRGGLPLFALGFLFCATILTITVWRKFLEGGWITLTVTGSVILLCFIIRRHYRQVGAKLDDLYKELEHLPPGGGPPPGEIDPKKPVAGVLVANYGGLGIHTFVNVFRSFPGHFQGLVFLSIGVIDSREFKGEGTLEGLEESVVKNLEKYVELARGLGIPATYRLGTGTDAVAEAEKLCLEVIKDFPQTTFFAGKVLFQRERWFQGILHNETAFAIQKRLQWAGRTVVVIPARVS